MNPMGKWLQAVTAGAGFLAGYLWAVVRWWREIAPEPHLWAARSCVPWGVFLSAVYALLLAGLFWPLLPAPRTSGLRMVVCPTAFTLSSVAAALGVSVALRILS